MGMLNNTASLTGTFGGDTVLNETTTTVLDTGNFMVKYTVQIDCCNTINIYIMKQKEIIK